MMGVGLGKLLRKNIKTGTVKVGERSYKFTEKTYNANKDFFSKKDVKFNVRKHFFKEKLLGCSYEIAGKNYYLKQDKNGLITKTYVRKGLLQGWRKDGQKRVYKLADNKCLEKTAYDSKGNLIKKKVLKSDNIVISTKYTVQPQQKSAASSSVTAETPKVPADKSSSSYTSKKAQEVKHPQTPKPAPTKKQAPKKTVHINNSEYKFTKITSSTPESAFKKKLAKYTERMNNKSDFLSIKEDKDYYLKSANYCSGFMKKYIKGGKEGRTYVYEQGKNNFTKTTYAPNGDILKEKVLTPKITTTTEYTKVASTAPAFSVDEFTAQTSKQATVATSDNAKKLALDEPVIIKGSVQTSDGLYKTTETVSSVDPSVYNHKLNKLSDKLEYKYFCNERGHDVEDPGVVLKNEKGFYYSLSDTKGVVTKKHLTGPKTGQTSFYTEYKNGKSKKFNKLTLDKNGYLIKETMLSHGTENALGTLKETQYITKDSESISTTSSKMYDDKLNTLNSKKEEIAQNNNGKVQKTAKDGSTYELKLRDNEVVKKYLSGKKEGQIRKYKEYAHGMLNKRTFDKDGYLTKEKTLKPETGNKYATIKETLFKKKPLKLSSMLNVQE